MSESTRAGAQLLDEIKAKQIPEGALGIWWLGQASFVVKATVNGASHTIYLDPFLVPHHSRLVPPAFPGEAVDNADLVLCTHDHLDHIDPVALPAIAKASPRAKVLVPGIARDKVIGLGIPADQVVVPPIDAAVEYSAASVTAIPAAHEELDYSPERGYPYLGYVVRLGDMTLYHSGDCTIYEGLAERLKAHRPDVALLPINGHDWYRTREGTIGNMTYREAVDLAHDVGIGLTIPMHFGMFRGNTEPPGNFVNYVHEFYPEMATKVMARYEGLVYLK